MPRFRDIVPFTRGGSYSATTPWDHLERTLERYGEDYGLDLDPDFQRAHVWNEEKRSKFVEYILRNGHSARDIYFNCPDWMGNNPGRLVLVDGKQRLEAVRRFLDNRTKAFGSFYREYTDRFNMLTCYFNFVVNNLPDRKSVLQWYIDLNDGGVSHTKKEISKVRALLASSHGKENA